MSGSSSDAECKSGHECARPGYYGFGTCQPPRQCRSPKDCRDGYYCNWTGTCFRLGDNGCSSKSDCKVGHACVHDRRLMDAPSGKCHQQCTTDEACPAGYTCEPQSIAYNAIQLYPNHGLSNGVCYQSLTYLDIGK